MLARRFTIICLMTMLFGMGLAMLVAEAGRSSRTPDMGILVRCGAEAAVPCPPPGY